MTAPRNPLAPRTARSLLPLIMLAACGTMLSGCIIVLGGSSRSYEDDGTTSPSPRQRIGVELEKPDRALATQLGIDANRATMIAGVLPGSPAARAGIQQFDVVTGVGVKDSASILDLRAAVYDAKPGEAICLKLLRAGQPLEIHVIPEDRTDWNK